ncbi:SDR family NAD(P)-dependent oxidoreductase [Streptomyces sp. NPDC093149]|uniref:SDR family NAD(P)-dependent oxidoreductase n=1 Tax=Streptomyces sp. NPDC093149 TaxID=3366031 RepID=UPI0037FFB222
MADRPGRPRAAGAPPWSATPACPPTRPPSTSNWTAGTPRWTSISPAPSSARAAARIMREGDGGVVLTTSSMYGGTAGPERAAYCATKAAVAALTKVLAVEWAPFGIRVNALGPGYVETDLVTRLAAAGRLDTEALRRRTPRGRLGRPEDFAHLALFLASGVSANITGQMVVSDGGWTADGCAVAPG